MALLRLIVLLLLIAVFAALAVQNTVLYPLVILGQKTISLPLWSWLLGALVLGGLTSIFLSGLIQWTAFWSRRHERKVMRSVPAGAPRAKGWGFGRKSSPDQVETSPNAASPRPAAQNAAYQPPPPPKEVVDADFRVIRPPSRSLEDE
ncbi:hypothetical protein IQ266_06635 [filamentous cyanobacterium LEGE 11480]|uniref:Lipopolysaccharide assembly protein A domain-containing protein n=1 Tax=Romeriopsis navalis LEGE 11480 TaxID=2777977 RepID=A0A928VP25_9CYAN|nr:hypothetical protein [Romeriopsis navalis]MBE9029439.1 hypothetical protein [Romeriopsis navalis LEGE 11480]